MEAGARAVSRWSAVAMIVVGAALLAFGASVPGAQAGPPYVTDDPAPTDTGHWEIYNFVTGVHTPGDTSGEAGFDINYGAAKDLQLTLVLPLAFDDAETADVGSGPVEMAAKYEFLHQRDGELTPDVAVFPRLFLPTAGRRFSSGRFSLFVPLWAEKDFGKWSLFGGGGYDINPGPGERNFWMSGVVLSRTVSDKLSIGAEVDRQTPDATDAKPFTGLNLGVTYRLTPHWSLLAASGPGVQNAGRQGQYVVYLSLKADY